MAHYTNTPTNGTLHHYTNKWHTARLHMLLPSRLEHFILSYSRRFVPSKLAFQLPKSTPFLRSSVNSTRVGITTECCGNSIVTRHILLKFYSPLLWWYLVNVETCSQAYIDYALLFYNIHRYQRILSITLRLIIYTDQNRPKLVINYIWMDIYQYRINNVTRY